MFRNGCCVLWNGFSVLTCAEMRPFRLKLGQCGPFHRRLGSDGLEYWLGHAVDVPQQRLHVHNERFTRPKTAEFVVREQADRFCVPRRRPPVPKWHFLAAVFVVGRIRGQGVVLWAWRSVLRRGFVLASMHHADVLAIVAKVSVPAA